MGTATLNFVIEDGAGSSQIFHLISARGHLDGDLRKVFGHIENGKAAYRIATDAKRDCKSSSSENR